MFILILQKHDKVLILCSRYPVRKHAGSPQGVPSWRTLLDCYTGTLSYGEITASHSKIGDTEMKSPGSRSSNGFQWLDWMSGYQFSITSNEHQNNSSFSTFDGFLLKSHMPWGCSIIVYLKTHWGWSKKVATLQTTFSNPFSWKFCISTDISKKFVPEGLLDNKSSMAEVMAWHQR